MIMRNDWQKIEEKVKKICIDQEKLKKAKIILFGAGLNGSIAYEELKKDFTIYAFTDNNSKLWGGKKETLAIISPNELKNISDIFVIISVNGANINVIKRQLEEMQLEYCTYFEYIISNKWKLFCKVYQEILEDDFSKSTYQSVISANLTGDWEKIKEVFVKEQYFALPQFYSLQVKPDVFVDLGAYVGDVLEEFIKRRGEIIKAYCFEPSERSYKALEVRKLRLEAEWALEEDQIILEKKLVGSKKGVGTLVEVGGGTANHMENSTKKGKTVEIISLDEYFSDKKEKPTLIKADIEGAEMEMLKGASQIISVYKPMLAISVYHRGEDLYKLPLLIKKLNPNYRMELRQHAVNCFETVLYCY